MNPEIDVDTHPAFEIHTASEISDDAESFVSAVIDNQGLMFWTDFALVPTEAPMTLVTRGRGTIHRCPLSDIHWCERHERGSPGRRMIF